MVVAVVAVVAVAAGVGALGPGPALHPWRQRLPPPLLQVPLCASKPTSCAAASSARYATQQFSQPPLPHGCMQPCSKMGPPKVTCVCVCTCPVVVPLAGDQRSRQPSG